MNTKVWAHRGASGYAPENTLEAFELAAKQKADGVELDVQLSKDGELDAAATAHNVVAENTPGQNSNAVAELVFGLLVFTVRLWIWSRRFHWVRF